MYRIFFVFLAALLLSGCRQEAPPEPEPLYHYVTRVDITCNYGGENCYKQFTQEEKIRSILHYLRLLQDDGSLEDLPADKSGAEYEILLFFSDGGCRTYRQMDTDYICQDEGRWRILKPSQGRKLLTLFRLLPSDV